MKFGPAFEIAHRRDESSNTQLTEIKSPTLYSGHPLAIGERPVAVEPAETLAKGAARKRGFAQQLREDAALMPPEVGADYLAWAAQADDEADALEAAALIAAE